MKRLIVVAAMLAVTPVAAKAHARHHHRHHASHHRRHHPMVEALGKGLAHMIDETLGNIGGMNDAFVEKLGKAFAAIDGGSCRVGSGFRSHAEQARLHRAKPGLAARPGHSNHERGLAADLDCTGSGLRWMHAHAAEYGLRFPMSYEAWHIEPEGATRVASHRHEGRRHYAHHWHGHRYARAG